MMFAHDNAIENLVIFAPLVLIFRRAQPCATAITAFAGALYFLRHGSPICVDLHLPAGRSARTLAFTGGFVAQILLLIENPAGSISTTEGNSATCSRPVVSG